MSAPATCGSLLGLPKTVSWPPKKKIKSKSLHQELDLPLAAEGTKGEFVVFLRVNSDVSEMFSIGLRYSEPGKKDCVLLRVNGDHGQHRNTDGEILTGPHAHKPEPERDPWTLPGAGPRDAEALDPSFNHLPAAWAMFCGIANVASNEDVDRLVGKLQSVSTQLSLDYSDDGND